MEIDQEPVQILTQDPGPRPAQGPRITTRYITKYEKARVLGTRALQIRYILILTLFFDVVFNVFDVVCEIVFLV